MPTNPNMVAIQTVTVGSGGAASIDFTNIPQTYTDLYIVASVRTNDGSGSDQMLVKFNGSTTGYSARLVGGNGSSASSVSIAQYVMPNNTTGQTASTFNSGSMYIPNYTGSNNKSYSSEGVQETNGTTALMWMTAGLWSNTAAITSISLVPSLASFVQYSTATLYGVTSAGYGAKATGGIITSDANYYYHTFLASGTFTPTQSLTADCLVIAGGGAGGYDTAGGGGAGGISYSSGQSLTATGYTVTVGAGAAGRNTAGIGANGSNSQFGSLTAAVGGGGGGFYGGNGGNGGSGGGAGGGTSAGTATSGQGFAGGATAGGWGGGGGGAGEAGSTDGNSFGGDGTNTYSAWATATYTGADSGYYAGGGTAYNTNTPIGGLGGGGTLGGTQSGTANTGGGGSAYSGATSTSGAGGSGIVIVRYSK
jgi:hypothetical protein